MLEGDVSENPYAPTEGAAGAKPKLPPITPREWSFLLVLAAIQFTNIVDFMIIMPLQPRYKIAMPGITPFMFGVIVAAYGFSAGVSGLLGGFFNDIFDRKRSLLVLYAGFTIGTFLCGIAPDYWSLVCARVVAGAFGGVMGAATLAIVGDLFQDARRGRATGAIMWGFSVASIVGVPLGLELSDAFKSERQSEALFSVQVPFLAVAVFCVLLWIVAVFVLPPIRGHLVHHRPDMLGPLLRVLTDSAHLRAYLFMFFLIMSTFLLAPFLAAYVVANVGRSKEELKWIYVCGGVATFLVLPAVGILSDRFGKLPVFRITGTLTIIPIILLTNLAPLFEWTHVPASLTLTLTLTATTLFMVFSSARSVPAMAMITASSRPRYRGSFLSVNASVQQFACAIAAAIGGLILGQHETDSPFENVNAPLENFPSVGAIAVVICIGSVLLAERLRPADIEPDEPNAPETEEELLLEGRASDTGAVSTS
jgi:DHA1 family inner membrane transport protein